MMSSSSNRGRPVETVTEAAEHRDEIFEEISYVDIEVISHGLHFHGKPCAC
jgi:ribosomal protein L3